MGLRDVGVNFVAKNEANFLKALSGADKAVSRLSENLSKSTSKATGGTFDKITQSAAEMGKKLSGISSGLDDVFDIFGGKIAEVGHRFTGVASSAGNFASMLGTIPPQALAVAAAVAAIAAASIAGLQAFGTLQKGMNEVFSLLPDLSRTAERQMTTDIQNLNLRFGQLSGQTVPALYEAISAGIPQDNAFAFLETAQKAAVGGVTELKTTVDGISSVINAYGSDVISAAQASDQMFVAVKLGKTTFDQLSASLYQVNPIAANMGIRFDNVAAAVAALTSVGVPTAGAMTQIRAAFTALDKPGNQAALFFERIAGKTFREFIAEGHNVGEAFNLIANKAAEAGIPLSGVFTEIEAAQGVMGLTGTNAQRFAGFLDQMATSAGATDAAFAKMDQGLIPAMGRVQAVVQTLLEQVGQILEPIVTPIIEIVAAIGRNLSAWMRVASELINLLFGPIIDGFGTWASLMVSFGNTITWVVNRVADFIGWINGMRDALWNAFGGALMNLTKPVRDIMSQIITIVQLGAPKLLLAGAKLMGELASGIIYGATFVVRAVRMVAEAIAGFLVGQSPPPMGPLSTIDEGGANTMSAWLDGFAGQSLQPIQQVAANVTAAMGNIATMSLAGVEGRLKQLDAAILPFSNQLKIVQARFDAINEPAQAAISAIDRQIEKSLGAIASGDQQAAALARSLDAQRESILQAVDMRQAQVDQAQIQLALAKSQQVEERSLLEIRKAQFGEQQKLVKATKKTEKKPKEEKEKQGKEDKFAGVSQGTAADMLPPTVEAPEGQAGDSGFGSQLLGAFADPLMGNLGAFNTEVDGMQAAFGSITPSAIGSKFGAMFSGLGETIQTNLVAPFQEKVDEVIRFLTGSDEPSIRHAASQIGSQIGTWVGDLRTTLTTTIAGPVNDAVTAAVGYLVGTGTPSLYLSISGLPAQITGWLATLPTQLQLYLTDAFSLAVGTIAALFGFGSGVVPAGMVSFPTMLQNAVTNIPIWLTGLALQLGTALRTPFITIITDLISQFSDTANPLSLAYKIFTLPAQLLLWLVGLPAALLTSLQTPFSNSIAAISDFFFNTENPESLAGKLFNFFSGTGEGTLSHFIAIGTDAFLLFATTGVPNALRSFGTGIWNMLAVPLINVLNWMIDRLNDFITGANNILSGMSGFLNNVGIQGPTGMTTIPRISTAPPSFLTGAATGGLFGPGFLRVGEKGEEIIQSSSKLSVFPNPMLRAMESIAASTTSPSVVPMVGNGSSSTDNSSIDNSLNPTFNGVGDSGNVMQRLALLRAQGRSTWR